MRRRRCGGGWRAGGPPPAVCCGAPGRARAPRTPGGRSRSPTARRAPRRWLAGGRARLGDLLRDPETREDPLHAVALLVLRDDEATLAPPDDFVLQAGDELLLAGRPGARRALSTILFVDAALEYVVSGRRVPESWIWRKLSRTSTSEPLSTTPS